MSHELPEADTVVRNLGLLATLKGPRPRLGAALRDIGAMKKAAVAIRAGRIVFVGPEADLAGSVRTTPNVIEVDAGGAAVIPGFVDAHTHLAYAGDRDEEIRVRLAGIRWRLT